MRKLILAVLMVLVLTVPVMAFDEFPCQPKVVEAMSAKILEMPPINLNGIAVWLPDGNQFAVGGLTDVATIYGFTNLSVLAATTVTDTEGDEDAGTMVGPAIGINIPALVKKLGGVWISDSIASSVGISYLYDVGDSKFRLGIYGSLIRINVDQVMKKMGLM